MFIRCSSSFIKQCHHIVRTVVKKQKTDSKHPKLENTSKGKVMILSKCAVWGSQKLRFIRERKASGILSSVGIKTKLNQIHLVGSIFN